MCPDGLIGGKSGSAWQAKKRGVAAKKKVGELKAGAMLAGTRVSDLLRDKPKIEVLEKIKHFFVAHFTSSTEMHAALGRVSADIKNETLQPKIGVAK
ncbi:hypothetical protein N0V95_004356 [Ascochyta clinopodiicola]|nr:hypothetical protein N0V95_004356 [Ascochyta clinopodiicola]